MEHFDLCGNFPVKVVRLRKWSSLTGWSSPTKTCHSISKKFLFPVLHVICCAVIKMSVETQIDHFDSTGSFVSIQPWCSIFPLIIPLVADCLVWQSEKGPQINTLSTTKTFAFYPWASSGQRVKKSYAKSAYERKEVSDSGISSVNKRKS